MALQEIKVHIGEILKEFKTERKSEMKRSSREVVGEVEAEFSGRVENGMDEICNTGWLVIPSCKNLREVIMHWKVGCPEKIVICPLQDWPFEAQNASLKIRPSLCDRKVIGEEYEWLGEEPFVPK